MEEMESKGREAERETEGHRLSNVLDGARMVASAFALLRFAERYIEPRRVLRYLGLHRRRSFWGSAALLGAGALAGAGVAIMVSPRSGSQTREGMVRSLRKIGRKGREMARSVGARLAEEGETPERSGGQDKGRRELPQGAKGGEVGSREHAPGAKGGEVGSREHAPGAKASEHGSREHAPGPNAAR